MPKLRMSGWLAVPTACVVVGAAGLSHGRTPSQSPPAASGAITTHVVAEGERHVAVDRLAWLAGCWEGTLSSGATYEEAWLAPRGGIMVGMARMTRDGRSLSYEFMRIAPGDGDALVFHAQPSGRTATPFRSTELTASSVTFENPDHDFPQRVRYRFMPPDELHARIEGVRNGQAGALDFPLRRVGCPG